MRLKWGSAGSLADCRWQSRVQAGTHITQRNAAPSDRRDESSL